MSKKYLILEVEDIQSAIRAGDLRYHELEHLVDCVLCACHRQGKSPHAEVRKILEEVARKV